MGPNGEDEWVQTGIAGYPDGHSALYYEYMLPGPVRPVFVSLGPVSPGSGHTLAVRERPSQPGAWRVWLDGQRVSPPIVLAGSNGAWRPIATAETWNRAVRGCNRYSYDFSALAVATTLAGDWQPFRLDQPIQDPGYTVRRRTDAFAASALP